MSDDANNLVLKQCDVVQDNVGSVIVPSKPVELIIDKLVDYIARAGIAFENRVVSAISNDARFAFLFSGDNFNPYYTAMLRRKGIVPSTRSSYSFVNFP